MLHKWKTIPEGWQGAKISDIGEVITGTTPSTKNESFWGGEIPFVTPSDFKGRKYVTTTEKAVTLEGAREGRIVPKDAVMVVCIASVGEVAMASTNCITNQQINSIACESNVDPHYVYYALLFSKEQLKTWAGITTTPIVKKSLFEKFPILLPPLNEQRKIAKILGTIDKGIERVEQEIEHTERLKKGLMQQLLTRGIGHKEFKDSPIGKIPGDWEVVKLQDVTLKAKSLDASTLSEFDYVDISSIDNQTFKITNWARLKGKQAPSRARRLIRKDDILFATTRPYLKNIAIVPPELDGQICSTGFCVIRADRSKAEPHWIFYYVQTDRFVKRIAAKMKGATYPAVADKDVLMEKILLPPLPEQKRIAEILETVSRKLELLRQKKERLQRIKKGLMNDLLTGRRRVKIHHAEI